MSDYMFMLESHLTTDQNRAMAHLQAACAECSLPLYLTGGALRDMLGGFPIRDLDFTVEGNPAKLWKAITKIAGVELLACDDHRKQAEFLFPGGVTMSVGMSRLERYLKPGGRPQIQPASIREDLRCRDFTINSMALSLNAASRGLPIDPNNGLADLDRREIRTVTSYALYDDPSRLLRLIRLKTRLGYAVDERTQSQYGNAREAGAESKIGPPALLAELRSMAREPNPGEVVRVLEEEKLLTLFGPALKANPTGFGKLQKARQLVPFGCDLDQGTLGLFLVLLTENLSPKDKAGVVAATGMEQPEIEAWQKLEARSKKLEKSLMASGLQRPSALYKLLAKAEGEQVLFLLIRSTQRLVQDRLKNYLQKYLPSAMEVTDRDVIATGADPASPKFAKEKLEFICQKLDARPKKVVEPEPELVAAPAMARGRGM